MRRTSRRREPEPEASETREPPVDIAPDDPLLEHLRRTAAPVDLAALDLDSPAVTDLRASGIVLVVPLVTAGELVGVLNLGPRRSEQGYSTDDRRLLDTPAGHAAPTLRDTGDTAGADEPRAAAAAGVRPVPTTTGRSSV